ncbi:MAG: hypothetical protein P8X63_11005 [Desulfuromonadaceae bacterium]
MNQIKLYDTTLRDGTQGEDVSFLVADKIRIAQLLDDLGIHYIEGGWPGSNPKDIAFFKDIKKVTLNQAKIAAFGSTRRAKTTPDKDNNIRTLIQAEPDAVTIFGKTWDFHVHEALRISLEENLELIHDSLAYLKEHVGEVIYDAEHFFDGYKANPEYALKTLQAALLPQPGLRVEAQEQDPHAGAAGLHYDLAELPVPPWAFIPTMTVSAPWPTPSPPSPMALCRCRGPSTVSVNVAAMPISVP